MESNIWDKIDNACDKIKDIPKKIKHDLWDRWNLKLWDGLYLSGPLVFLFTGGGWIGAQIASEAISALTYFACGATTAVLGVAGLIQAEEINQKHAKKKPEDKNAAKDPWAPPSAKEAEAPALTREEQNAVAFDWAKQSGLRALGLVGGAVLGLCVSTAFSLAVNQINPPEPQVAQQAPEVTRYPISTPRTTLTLENL